MTLSQFIHKYAPASENDTAKYIQDAIQATGATENTLLSSIDPSAISSFMAKKESGSTLAFDQSSQEGANNSITSWVNDINSGHATLNNVPIVIRNQVAKELAKTNVKTPAQQAKIMSEVNGYPKLIKGGGGGGFFGLGKSDSWAYKDPETGQTSYAGTYEEAVNQQNALTAKALGVNQSVSNSITIAGQDYTVGEEISNGDLTLTVQSDGTLLGTDGKKYDSSGNVIS